MGTTRRWRLLLAATVLLSTLLAFAAIKRETADAAAPGCTPTCVILIQVDGLEPKDVTPATTPYMWALAHPPQMPGGGGGAALSNRSGWIWQAPRGVVSTGTAAATASLLTGAYPELSGVPSDDFYRARGADFPHQRLGAGGFGDSSPDAPAGAPQSRDGAGPLEAPPVTTLIEAVQSTGGQAAVYLGDPTLAKVAHANDADTAAYWYPPGDNATTASTPEQQFTGNPLLCPVPRYLNDSAPRANGPNPSWCPADDKTTANKAARDLAAKPNVGFTFLHLAELGVAKRWAGNPAVGPDSELAPPQPSQALSHADDAIGMFLEQYAQQSPAKWQDTVVMVVGSHGYQLTPLADRVPDPGVAADATGVQDLTDYVDRVSREELKLVPQGTMATIYYRPEANPGTIDQEARRKALETIKADLERGAEESGSVNAACQNLNRVLGPCIAEVLYVDPETPGTGDTVEAKHPTWELDVRDPDRGDLTGASGDLVVVLRRGWATGRAAGLLDTGGLGTDAQAISNPYTASSGGPQERAVAALVNGPRLAAIPGAVRNLGDSVRYHPVSRQSVDPSDPANPPPSDDPRCPDLPESTDFGGLTCANQPSKVGDDADDPGHESQPITVDFAVTVSALMRLPFDAYPHQLQGRVLQEAFVNPHSTECLSVECPPPPPPECEDIAGLTQRDQALALQLTCRDSEGDPMTYSIVSGPTNGSVALGPGGTVTYTPRAGFVGEDTFTYQATSENGESAPATATLIVFEPPQVERRPEFDFTGLVRGLKAIVVDARNRPWRNAPRGTRMSAIRLEGDFGKPETAVTLTFYRRAASPRRNARASRTVRLKAIARFDPFVVKRGHVTMRLKIPAQFKPTYIGLTAREVALSPNGKRRLSGGQPCTTLKTRARVRFRCTGPSRAVIVPLADAARLHKTKKTGAKPRPRKRR